MAAAVFQLLPLQFFFFALAASTAVAASTVDHTFDMSYQLLYRVLDRVFGHLKKLITKSVGKL